MSEVHLFIAKAKARTMKKYLAVDSVSFIYLVGDLEVFEFQLKRAKEEVIGFFQIFGVQCCIVGTLLSKLFLLWEYSCQLNE